mmetsp:Transcript_14938/g.42378  ORF Transcript_14938/g.42378 Transcript_14938/m.42378 type:complete len:270 (-) Transcript_14938:107-916(-)
MEPCSRTSRHPRRPRVSNTAPTPLFSSSPHASESFSTFLPVKSCNSGSFTHKTSHNFQISSGNGEVGAGAALNTVNTFLALAFLRAAMFVLTGTSSCVSITEAPSKTVSATSSGVSFAFAPLATTIVFSPLESTVINATPVAASLVSTTRFASMPNLSKFLRVAWPRSSLPTLMTTRTGLPNKAAAAAWFAPLPPNSCSKRLPIKVSPGFGNLGELTTRSTLAEPTTTTAILCGATGVRERFGCFWLCRLIRDDWRQRLSSQRGWSCVR